MRERLRNICIFRSRNTSAYIYDNCSSDSMTDKTPILRKSYEYASELRKNEHLLILKLLFSSIFCWYFRYFVSETYLFSDQSPITSAYIYNQCSFLSLRTVWHYNINDSRLCRQNTNIEKIYVHICERAERAKKFSHFHIEKLLFLSIFCWYVRNFVGTNDRVVGLHVPTDFQMYQQNSEKALLGGGGNCPCPPPPPLWLR